MSKSSNRPSHRVYAVTKNGKQSYWQPIGAAWPHGDGEGFNLKLDYLPLNRRGHRYPQAEGRTGRGGSRSRGRLRLRAAPQGAALFLVASRIAVMAKPDTILIGGHAYSWQRLVELRRSLRLGGRSSAASSPCSNLSKIAAPQRNVPPKGVSASRSCPA